MSKRTDTIITTILVAILIILSAIFGVILFQRASMTDKERQQEQIEHAQHVAENTITYEVIYAERTTLTKTNGFGGVIAEYPAWRFGYIDENGKLIEKDGFRNLEYGTTHVELSEDDKATYAVYRENKTLYLPENWLKQHIDKD